MPVFYEIPDTLFPGNTRSLVLLTGFSPFSFQLDALKRTVDRTAVDLESTRSHVSNLKKDVLDKQEK